MRELRFERAGRLAWHERDPPELHDPGDAIVRPFVAGRCDGDTLPIHRPVSRALQAGLALRLVDPVVGHICGRVPFRGPFAIGHECVAEIVPLGTAVTGLRVGQRVIVPWAVSCGSCPQCERGLTAKCGTTAGDGVLAAYGFGPASGSWGGMVTDALRVPFAGHLLVPVPPGIPAERVAAAGDNLADAWRAVTREAGAYDVVVEATTRPAGLRRGVRALAPGGVCTAVGYYLATGTRVPLRREPLTLEGTP